MLPVDLKQMHQRAIIICAGEATRWDNYLGVKKHFIEIGGEKLLHRTVRLLKENGINDIYIVNKGESEYKIKGTKSFIPELNEYNGGVDKFINSKELWLENGRTIVLYGDVYFSEYAMEKIVTHNNYDWQLFGRAFGSRVTGCPWGECFAQTFFGQHRTEHLEKLEAAVEMWHKGEIRNPSGWQHYRFMINLPKDRVDVIMVGDRFINIDDETDDFDTKEDYITWKENTKL